LAGRDRVVRVTVTAPGATVTSASSAVVDFFNFNLASIYHLSLRFFMFFSSFVKWFAQFAHTSNVSHCFGVELKRKKKRLAAANRAPTRIRLLVAAVSVYFEVYSYMISPSKYEIYIMVPNTMAAGEFCTWYICVY